MKKSLIVLILGLSSILLYSQGTVSFELVESVDNSCGPQSDCTMNTICFELRAQPTDFNGEAILVSYEYSFCYDPAVLTYASDAACLINDGNDFNAGFFGEYNVGGNSNISGTEVLPAGVFTPIHTICFTYNNAEDLENTEVVGGCEDPIFIIPANTSQVNDDDGPQSVESYVEDALTLSAANVTCLVLPVEWLAFEATKRASSVSLDWSTAIEINNEYFEILHSVDAKKWNSIGSILGAGNSSKVENYSFLHRNPDAGANYYKIKQVDFDGRSETSDIKRIFFKDDRTVSYFPNPAYGSFTITSEKNLKDGKVLLSDINSKNAKTYDFISGESMDLTDVLPGVYFWKLISDNNEIAGTGKLIVIK